MKTDYEIHLFAAPFGPALAVRALCGVLRDLEEAPHAVAVPWDSPEFCVRCARLFLPLRGRVRPVPLRVLRVLLERPAEVVDLAARRRP